MAFKRVPHPGCMIAFDLILTAASVFICVISGVSASFYNYCDDCDQSAFSGRFWARSVATVVFSSLVAYVFDLSGQWSYSHANFFPEQLISRSLLSLAWMSTTGARACISRSLMTKLQPTHRLADITITTIIHPENNLAGL